jgi:hypothetical protein
VRSWAPIRGSGALKVEASVREQLIVRTQYVKGFDHEVKQEDVAKRKQPKKKVRVGDEKEGGDAGGSSGLWQ